MRQTHHEQVLAHVLIDVEHDQLDDSHEYQLHVGRLTQERSHGDERRGDGDVRVEEAESGGRIAPMFDN